MLSVILEKREVDLGIAGDSFDFFCFDQFRFLAIKLLVGLLFMP